MNGIYKINSHTKRQFLEQMYSTLEVNIDQHIGSIQKPGSALGLGFFLLGHRNLFFEINKNNN